LLRLNRQAEAAIDLPGSTKSPEGLYLAHSAPGRQNVEL